MINIKDLDQKSGIAEAYRIIRTNIIFSDVDNNLKTILFTSTSKCEGKSTVISNLAYSFSRLENKKILLLDLDLRNPTVHKLFGVSNTNGVMDILKDNKVKNKCILKIEDNLHVVPSGVIPPNPAEILSSKRFGEFLESIKEEYDYVFIDAPPIGIVPDANIISTYVDGVMFLVGANDVDLKYAQVAIENLKKANVNIIGSVLNKYEVTEPDYGYYTYYYDDEDRGKVGGKHSKKRRSKRKMAKKKGLSFSR